MIIINSRWLLMGVLGVAVWGLGGVASTMAEPIPAQLVAGVDIHDAAQAFVGTWNRSRVSEGAKASMCITKTKTPGRLYVRMNCCNGGNTGTLSGMATAKDDYVAYMTISDEDGHTAILKLTMAQLGIEVSLEGELSALGMGNGVTPEGGYVKGEPHYIQAVDPLCIFVTKDNVAEVKRILGETGYRSLADLMSQAVVLESEPYKYSGFIQGAGMELQLRGDKKGHWYIFGRNVFASEPELILYTNDSGCTEVPAWVDVFGDLGQAKIIHR